MGTDKRRDLEIPPTGGRVDSNQIVQIMDDSVQFLTRLSVEFQESARKRAFSVGIIFAI